MRRDYSAEADSLKPFIVPWIQAAVAAVPSGGGGGGALGAHELNGPYHLGTLNRSQAPWVATDISAALAGHVAAADPHTQYVLNTGDTMTGNLTLPTLTATTSVTSPAILSTGDLTITPTGGDVFVVGRMDLTGRLLGGMGAQSTGGALDWNDTSNARSGSGLTLMRSADSANAPTGASTSAYYHPFNFEYSSKDGSGNVTQLAIPYSTTASINSGIYMRGRFAGAWSNWAKIISENTAGNVLIGTNTDSGYKLDVTGTARITTSLTTISSFVSGFTGSGLRLDDGVAVAGKTTLELDEMIVRGRMRVYELLIHQIRATNGSLFVSGVGKAKTVTGSGPYTIVTDTDHGFAANDLIRAQRFTGSGVYQSNMTVTSVATSLQFTATLSSGDAPAAGMEFVRIGNTSDTSRQGSIYLTADDTYAPYIDILDGVTSFAEWGAAAKIKVRLGRLTGIVDTTLNPSGYGLYSQNAFLSGTVSAANDVVRLDSTGVRVRATTGSSYASLNAYRFLNATGIELGGVYGRDYSSAFSVSLATTGDSSHTPATQVTSRGGTAVGGSAQVYLSATSQNATKSADILLDVTNSTSAILFQAADYAQFGMEVRASALHRPVTDLGASLGSGSYRWGSVYAGTVVATSGVTVGGTAVSLFGHTHDDRYYTEGETDGLLAAKLSLTGGTLTGTLNSRAIIPTADNAYDIGSATNRVQDLYVVNLVANNIIGTPAYGHAHDALDITSGTLDDARLPATMSGKTFSGGVVIDADTGTTSNFVRWLTDSANNKRWELLGRAHDFATSSQQNDLLLYHYDGSTYNLVWEVENSTRVLNFALTPTVGGSAIWHAGNDGAASGLDADLLDGNHASAFALAGHNHDSSYAALSAYNSHIANANAHHNQSHVLATAAGLGTDHTVSGLTAGHVLRASGASAAAFAQLAHSDLSGLTTGDPHTQYVKKAGDTMTGALTAPWIKNTPIAIAGTGALDMSMLGLYDRDELINADIRGVLTVTITGAGSVTTSSINAAFNARGSFMTITGTDNTTTQIVFHIDLLANQANYGNATWQPLFQYRLTMNGTFTHYRTIVCEVSPDNSTWYKPSGGEWETTAPHTSEIIPGLWMGGNANPGLPSNIYRYVRFTLSNRFENAGYANKASVWISHIGLRHNASPFSRAYVHANGDTMYGALVTRVSNAAAFDVQNASATSVFKVNTTSAIATVTGDIDVTGELLLADGTLGAPSLTFGADTDSGIYRSSSNTWYLVAGGVGAMAVLSTGVLVSGTLNTTGAAFLAPDTDTAHTAGRVRLGYAVGTDTASFSHVDRTTSADYALSQSQVGATILNGASAQTVSLAIAGTPQWTINSDRLLPRGDSLLDIGDYNRKARKLFLTELETQTLIAQKQIATIGGDLIVAPTTKLIAAIDAATGAPGGSSLYTTMIAYWTFNEAAAGTRTDSKGANDLSGLSVSYATGKLGNAGLFTGSNSAGATDNSELSVGDNDWYFSCWIYPTNDNGNLQCIAAKGTPAGSRAWALRVAFQVDNQVYLDVWNAGQTQTAFIGASTFGALSVNNWYFVECWHNATSNTIGVAVNRTENTASFTYGTADDTGPFTVGQFDSSEGFIGRIDELGFWKSAIPNSTDRNFLYNSGTGKTFDDIYQYGAAAINVDVEHNNLRSGEYFIMKTAPGGVQQFERFKTTSGASTITGGYRYTAQRDFDGTGTNNWTVGDAVVSEQKNAGEGYLWLTSTASEYGHNGPGMIGYVRTGTNAADIKPAFVAGNLRSFIDYATDEAGNAAGNDLTLTPTTGFRGYAIDRTNGLRLFNANIKLYNAGTQTVNIDNAGTDIWIGPSSSDKRVSWNGTALALKNSDITMFSGATETLRITTSDGFRLAAGNAAQNQIDVYSGSDRVYGQWTEIDAGNTLTRFDAIGKPGVGMGTLRLRSASSDGADSAYVEIGSTYINLYGKPVNVNHGLLVSGVLQAGITSSNIAIGSGSGTFGGGTVVVFVANATTVPTTAPTGGGILYAQGGAGKWLGSSGTVTTFGTAEPHCPVCGADYMTEFDNREYGYLAICLKCLADELGHRRWIVRGASRLN